MAGLAFSEVRKHYGDVEALRGLNLEVGNGELLVLLGPSGSGKTSALRVAAGLEDVTDGRVLIGGRDVTRLAPSRRNVSMVFQNYALFPHLTAGENITFGLAARRTPKAEARKRVRAAAELTGCSGILERRPYELSGGERQRVALARALARDPDVFLLDEPLSNLDAQLRTQTRAELKRLHARLGTTMLYVTHDQVEALTLGDRVAVIDAGVLQQLGSPDDIYRRPRNRFVATFIGTPAMNILPAETSDGLLRAGPFAFEASVERGRRLEAGIRPEHLRVTSAGDGVQGEVQVVEPAGSEAFVHVEAAGHALIARVPSELRPAQGAAVRLEVRPADVYLFDAESGVAVASPAAHVVP